MKTTLKVLFFLLLPVLAKAQYTQTDSLRMAFANATNDSLRYFLGNRLYNAYEETNKDSAFYYAKQNLQLARNNKEKLAEAYALNNTAYQLLNLGRLAESLQCLFKAFEITEDPKSESGKSWEFFSTPFNGNKRLLLLAYTHHMLGLLMFQTENREQEIIHFREAAKISAEIGHSIRQTMANMNLGRSYLLIGKLDSALILERTAEAIAIKSNFRKYLGQVYTLMGGIYSRMGDSEKSLQYFHISAETSIQQKNPTSLAVAYFNLTNYYLAKKDGDSSLYYALRTREVFQTLGAFTGVTLNMGTIYENIYSSYKLLNQYDSVFKYQGLTLTTKDSLYRIRIKNLSEFQAVGFTEQLRLQQVEKERSLYQSKVRTYALLGGLAMFLLIAIILYRSNRQKQKSNKVLEATLTDLKSTQSQLIQSEKMASLGELTAGIAHEIQNPLNFVNNFSEVSLELIDEVKSEKSKVKTEQDENLENQLLSDIANNLEKINHHGKRADAIVKGMLQHSRSSSGVKEPTDINELADEYLRLAYHGLRAKDKSFNATLLTDYDKSIGKVNVIPQDLGRVILNLITNAFYAVSAEALAKADARGSEDKSSYAKGSEDKSSYAKASGDKYEPTVSVSTKKVNGRIELSVKDNGNGIPSKVLDKIFQPFFTTKPTGQGTGLGLSLAYDIVRAHGGEIKVDTKENEGTSFTIILPA